MLAAAGLIAARSGVVRSWVTLRVHDCIQGEKEEASRVIFMGWPGQHELEDDRAAHRTHDSDGVTGSGLLQIEQMHASCTVIHPMCIFLTCQHCSSTSQSHVASMSTFCDEIGKATAMEASALTMQPRRGKPISRRYGGAEQLTRFEAIC